MASSVRRIRHVIPLVEGSARQELRLAQDATLASVAVARRHALDVLGLEIEVVGAHSPDVDPPADLEWLRAVPTLATEAASLAQFARPRRLPLLREVLAGLDGGRGVDAVICSNTDIGLRPDFYATIAEILAEGYDAFTVNRRCLTERWERPAGAIERAEVGSRHPGSDCFVMTPDVLRQVDVGDCLLGTKFVGLTLIEEMARSARRFRRFSDLAVTWHRGNDVPWRASELDDYRDFNREQLRLRRVANGNPDRRVRLEWRRIIVSAAPARSGGRTLARVLSAIPSIDVEHRRSPTMLGPWVRDLAEMGLAATREHRRVKVDAIRADLRTALDSRLIYADITPAFLTTTHDVILDSFDHSKLAVIALRRDPIEIARSMLRDGWFAPGGDERADVTLDPDRTGSPLGIGPGDLHDRVDRVLAHIAEMLHARDRLRRRTPSVRWVDVDLTSLRSRSGIDAMLTALDLPRWPGVLPPALREFRQPSGRLRAGRHPWSRALVTARLEDFLGRLGDRDGMSSLADAVRP